MKATNEKSLIQKFLTFLKSDLLKSEAFKLIVYPIIVLLIGSCLTNYYWNKQFESIKEQKFLEYKISSFDQFTNIAYKRLYLSEFELIIDIEKFIEGVKIQENTQNLTGVTHELSQDQNFAIHKKVQEKFPLIYANYMKSLDLQNEYAAASSSLTILFSDSIINESNKFTSSFSKSDIFSIIDSALAAKQFGEYNINKDSIVKSIQGPRFENLKLLLNNMIKEIKNGKLHSSAKNK